MQRFVPHLGVVTAFIFFVFIVALANQVPAREFSAPDASTTSSAPSMSLLPITLPSLELGVETSITSEAQTAPEPKPKEAISPTKKAAPVPASEPVPVPVVAPLPVSVPVIQSGNAALDAAASALRGALVNILCYVPEGSGLHSISGSGIIIDPKGIILTNAHVAQYFLLADRGASCTIRTGSPAVDSYGAALIYISPAWINANADILTKVAPSGTGEYDFALLAVTKSIGFGTLPNVFPSVSLATTPPQSGTAVVIATYGAQFLESNQVRFSLFPTVVFGSVKDVFTFGTNTIDVLALGGSVAAQEGSSGGGVADASGNLVATITTSTIEGATDTRSLDAITASYIRAEYANETSEALDLLFAGSISSAIAKFAPQISTLAAILTANLP